MLEEECVSPHCPWWYPYIQSVSHLLNLLSEGYFLILGSDKKSCGALDEGNCHVGVASDRRRIKEIALRAGVTEWKY